MRERPVRVIAYPTASSLSKPPAADPLSFQQHIGAGDALRTGSYAKTLTFTLSTSTP